MKKLFIFAALAAPLFFSCAKEMEKALEQEPEKTPVANVAFKASIESLNSPTKADINASNQLVWAAGDQIGVYIPDWVDKNKSFTLVGAGGSTTGGFTYDGGEFSATTATVAYFPWNGTDTTTDNNVYEGTMYFKLPVAYFEYTSGKMLTPLVANITHTGDAYDDIQFKHAGAAVKVTINNLPAGAHSIGMSVTGQQVTGNDYKLDLTKVGTEAMVVDVDEPSNNSLWLNYEPADAERPFTFLFPVPELTNPTLTFEIWDENGIKVWQAGAKTKSGDNLDRAEVLEMPALDITPYKQFDAVSTDWTVIGTANGTNWDADLPMMTDGTLCIAKGIYFAADGEFKVRKEGKWDVAYPASNWAIWEGEGLYDIIFNSSDSEYNGYAAHEIRAVRSKCPYPDAGANVKLYVHPVTAVSNELCFKSDILGTASWPGTPFASYEIVAGQKFYTMEFPAYKIWGKTITDLYVVDRDTWSAKDGGCTLTFPGTEMAYYINATKNVALELLAKRPTEPSIAIDGSFSDWDGIAGNSNTNSKENTVLMKSYSDGTDLFVYLKLTVKEGYPVDLSSGRYFRLYFDKDNNKTTGSADWYRTGAEAIPAGMENFLVYFNHSGSVDNADIQGIGSTWEIKCVNNSGASLEVELKVPISVLGKLAADTADPSDPDSDEIVIFCLGYRGGDYSEFSGSVSGVMIP